MKRNLTAVLLALTCAASACAGEIRLASPFLEVAWDPDQGRIVFFGAPGGPNLLYLRTPESVAAERATFNAWFSWGGDFIYPAQDSRYYFHTGTESPDLSFFTAPWRTLGAGPSRLEAQSGVSPSLGVSLRRVLKLDPAAPVLESEDTVRRETANPFFVHVATVTQLPHPLCLLLDEAALTGGGRPYLSLTKMPPPPGTVEAGGGVVRLTAPLSSQNIKIGTLGRWGAAVYADRIVLESTDGALDDGYLDGASIEAYSGAAWVELETVSPARHLRPGEELVHSVRWRLVPFTAPDDPSAIPAAALAALHPFLPQP